VSTLGYNARVSEPARKRPTFDELYAQIEALRTGLTGEILEPGVLRTMSRPGKSHRRTHRRIERALGAKDEAFGGTGWWIEIEAEVRLLDEYLLVPDLSGWRVERVPDLPDENPITIAPDWVCEIFSPSTARDDRRLKLPLYARAGIPHVWLVDPDQKLVEVYETRDQKPTLIASAAELEVVALPPYLDLPIELASLWLS
jgi:Uma2 family endonuclease